MELDHKGRDANWLNDEFIKHSKLCENFIKAIFPETADELLKDQKIIDGTHKFFEQRIERGDFD